MENPTHIPQKSGISEGTKALITVLLLIFMYPVGIVVMWAWPRWMGWVKVLVTLPLIIGVLMLMGLRDALRNRQPMKPASRQIRQYTAPSVINSASESSQKYQYR